MNTNNIKTGLIKIPGALTSTGGDGNGLVGGVVAYTGDIYDVALEKNQAAINNDLDSRATSLLNTINASSTAWSNLAPATNVTLEAITGLNATNAQDAFSEINTVIAPLRNGSALGTTIDDITTKGYKFGGFVTPSSSPISGAEKYFYIATQNGTYVNFGGIVLNDETAILYNTDSQHSTTAKCGQAICGYAICGTN